MKILKRKAFWIVLALLLLAGVGYRASKTAEFIARFGSARARADLCRALPGLSPSRQASLLKILLADPVEDVRLSAITACARGTEIPALDDLLEGILEAPASSSAERTKAGEVLLTRVQIRPAVLDFLKAHKDDETFRAQCPRLVVFYFANNLSAGALEDRLEIVSCSLNEDDPACEYFQKLILQHAEFFLPWRERFADAPGTERSSQLRQFCASVTGALEALTLAPAEEHPPAAEPESKDTFTAFDAAWLQDIRPNYQIADFQGHRCLTLEEGAGGVMSWLKGEDGTVDVGEARFSMYAPHDGPYELWARVYFDDKCGNSFGIWIDETQFGNFDDGTSRFRVWHWLQLQPGVQLKQGLHKGRLQAWEDGVYIEKFALLPPGSDPEKTDPPAKVHWDRSLPSSVSISLPYQSQYRGTTQTVTVWVRRNSPALTSGTVHLRVPAPFELADGKADQIVHFAEGSPVASTSFQVRLPEYATVGEVPLSATYTDASGKASTGEIILGGQFDWWTTGPLDPENPLSQKLAAKTALDPAELREGWSRFPQKGLDPYRRLNMEFAYGAIRNKFIYLSAEVQCAQGGEYLALLTADDTASVYIDGKLAIEQPGGGPGEGRLVMTPVHLDAGVHRLFARVYQDAAENPDDADKFRHTWNHCNFKFLLRKKRHEPAQGLVGLPHVENR